MNRRTCQNCTKCTKCKMCEAEREILTKFGWEQVAAAMLHASKPIPGVDDWAPGVLKMANTLLCMIQTLARSEGEDSKKFLESCKKYKNTILRNYLRDVQNPVELSSEFLEEFYHLFNFAK